MELFLSCIWKSVYQMESYKWNGCVTEHTGYDCPIFNCPPPKPYSFITLPVACVDFLTLSQRYILSVFFISANLIVK